MVAQQQRIFHRYPKATIIVLLSLFVLCCDVLAKNIIKWNGKRLLRQFYQEREYRISSPFFHHDLKPQVTIAKAVWGNLFYKVTTNSLGFKDGQPRQVEPRASGERLLFLGDSFTEGLGIEYEKTFAGLVAAQLSPQGIEVLNGGLSSYSPAIYFAKARYLLEEVGLQVHHIVVFLDISDIYNDGVEYELVENRVVYDQAVMEWDKEEGEAYERRYKSRRPLYQKVERVLRRDTLLPYFLLKTGHDLFNPRPLAYDYDSINLRKALWTSDEQLFREFGEQGLARCEKNLDRLLALCQKHDISLTLVVYPWPDQIVRNDLESIQVRYWADWTSRKGIPFINLFPEFIPAVTQSEEKIREVLDSYFIVGDVHWNEAGHRKIAEGFLRQYEKRQSAGL
jgi:hypothetical protein